MSLKSRSCRTLAIMLLVLALFVFGVASASADTTITVGTWLSPEGFWSNYGPMFKSFEEANPGVKIEVMTVGGHGEMASKTLFLAATGDEHLPDMIQFPPEQVGPVVDKGVFEDLEPWMARTEGLGLDQWIPAAKEAVRYHGVTFGVPAYVVNYTYAYNTDILGSRGIAPPEATEWVTWDKVRNIARKATLDSNGDGTPEIWGFNHGWIFDRVLSLLRQAGGEFYTEEGLAKVDTPEMYEAVKWLRDLINEDNVHSNDRLAFNTGEIATIRFGSYQMPSTIEAGTPVGMASGIQGKEKSDVFFVTPWTMTAASKHKDITWKLLTHLTSVESQAYMAREAHVPMRRDTPLPEETSMYLAAFIRNLEYSRVYPIHNESGFVQDTFNQAMAPVWEGKRDPKAALQELDRTLNAELKRRLSK